MKKKLLVLILASMSNLAFADYFGCNLKITNERAVDAEAEYRGREVSVSHKGWTCEANIDGNILVYVKLTYPELNVSSSAVDKASATTTLTIQNPEGELGDFISAKCNCGLR